MANDYNRPNEFDRPNEIEQSSNRNLEPTPNKDNKHAKKAGDGTMNFMFWSIAGTALAACSSPIFSDVADLAGGGGGGDTQSGAGAGAITNGRWAGAQVYMIDEDGFRVDESGTRNANADAVGYSDGAGDIIFNAGMSPMRDQLYVADLEGATEIVTDRQGMSGEELRSLPYEGGALIISPLTDLLARAYDDAPDSAKEDGEDAFYQDTLNDIYGVRPQFDAAGAPMVDGEGAFVNPTPLVTLADVLNADNYNPFVDGDTASDTVTEAVSLASNAVSVLARGASSSTPTERVAALVEGFEEFRTSVQSQRDETMLEPDLDSGQVLGVDLKSDVEASVTAAQPRPVVAIPEGRAPIRMTEDVDFTLVSGNAESLFGFKDPFGNADSPDDADTEREPGQLVGIYIEATSTGVDVMFRLENGTIVDLDDQRAVTERGAPSDGTSPAMTTVGNVRFFYVSEANFDQLILRPDDNFNTAAASVDNRQIRFYVYDGEHATVDNNDPIASLDSVGSLEIEVVAANDAPSAITLDNRVASYAGADNARPTDDVLIGTLSSVDVDSTTFTYDITAGRDNFVIGGANNDQLFLQIGAEARAVGMMWSVSITSTDDTGLTSTVQTFMITRGGLEVTPPGDNMDPVFSGGELLTEDVNPQTDNSISTPAPTNGGWNVLVGSTPTSVTGRGLLLGTLSDGGQSDSFVVVYGSGDSQLFAVGGDNNNELYYIGGATGNADAAASGTNILSHTVTIRGLDGQGRTVEDYEYVTNVADDPADNPPEIQGDDIGATITGSGDSASGRFMATDDTAGDTIAWTAPRVSGSTDYGSITFGTAADYETTWTFGLSQAGRAALDALGANDAALTTEFTITATDRMGNTDTKTLTITLQGVNDAPSEVTLDNRVASYAGAGIASPPGQDDVLIGTLGSVDVDSTTGFTYRITAGTENFVIGGADNDQLFLLANADGRAVGTMWSVSITSTDDTGLTSDPETFMITRGGLGVTPPASGADTVFTNGELLTEDVNPQTDTSISIAAPAGGWNVLVDGTAATVTGRGLLLGTLSDGGQSDSFVVVYGSGDNQLFAVLNSNELYYIGGAIGDADADPSGTNILRHEITIRGLDDQDGSTVQDHTYVTNVANDPDDDLPVINTSTSNFARTITDVPATTSFMATGDLVATDATNDSIAWTRTLTGTNYGDVTFADATLATTTWTFELNQAGLAALRALGAGDTPLTTTFNIIATDNDGADDETLTITLQGVNDAPTAITLDAPAIAYNGNTPPAGMVVARLSTTDVDTSDTHTYTITGGTHMNSFMIPTGTNELRFADAGAANINRGDAWSVEITSNDGTVPFTETITIMRSSLGVTPSGATTPVFSGGEGLLPEEYNPVDDSGLVGGSSIDDAGFTRTAAAQTWGVSTLDPEVTVAIPFTADMRDIGPLRFTAVKPGLSAPTGDDIPSVFVTFNINTSVTAEQVATITISEGDFPIINIQLHETSFGSGTALLTWNDIMRLINDHPAASELVSVEAIGPEAELNAIITNTAITDQSGLLSSGTAGAGATLTVSRPDTITVGENDELALTSKIPGDSSTAADTIPQVSVSLVIGAALGVVDNTPDADGNVEVTITATATTTWQQLEDFINAGTTGASEYISAAVVVADAADEEIEANDQVGTAIPNTVTVMDRNSVAQIRLIANDGAPNITFELAPGNSLGEVDIDTTTTPGTVAITYSYRADVLATLNWQGIALQINSASAITAYLRAENVEAQPSDAPNAEYFSVELLAPAVLTGGAGTPDQYTFADNGGSDNGGTDQLIFTSRIAGNNEAAGVPEIGVILVVDGPGDAGVTVSVSGADGDEERIITITAPEGTSWESISVEVNDHSVAGELVSVVGADSGTLTDTIVTTDATPVTPATRDSVTIGGEYVRFIDNTADAENRELRVEIVELAEGVNTVKDLNDADVTVTRGTPVLILDDSNANFVTLFVHILHGGVSFWNDIGAGGLENLGAANLSPNYSDFFMHEIPGSAEGIPVAGRHILSGGTDAMVVPEMLTGGTNAQDLVIARPVGPEEVTEVTTDSFYGLLIGELSDGQSTSFEVLYPVGSTADDYLFAVLNDDQLYYIGGAIGDADAPHHNVNNILRHEITVRGTAQNGDTEDYTYVVNVADALADNPPVINTSTSNFARTITDVPATTSFMATGDLVATDATNDDITWTRTRTGTDYGELTFADATEATTTWTFTLNAAGRAALRELGAGETRDTTFTIAATDSTLHNDTQTLTITLQGVNDAPSAVTLDRRPVASYMGADNAGPTADVLIGTLGSVDADDPDGDDTYTYAIVGTDGNRNFEIRGDQLYLQAGADARAPDGEWVVSITSTDSSNATFTEEFTITRGGNLEVVTDGERVLSNGEGLLPEDADPQTQALPDRTVSQAWDVRVLDPEVAEVGPTADMRDIGPLRFIAQNPGLSAPTGDDIPNIQFGITFDANIPESEGVRVTNTGSNHDDFPGILIQMHQTTGMANNVGTATWLDVIRAIEVHQGADGAPNARDLIRVEIIDPDANLGAVITQSDLGIVAVLDDLGATSAGTDGAGAPLIVSTADTITIGENGELVLTSEIPGDSSTAGDTIPRVSVRLVIGDPLSVVDGTPDDDGNVEVVITATDTTTWQQLENFINTGNIATTTGGSPESAYISAAVAIPTANGETIVDADLSPSSGFVEATADTITIGENDELALTSKILGDSSTASDAVPQVSVRLVIGNALSVADGTPDADGNVEVVITATATTTWQQLENFINTGDIATTTGGSPESAYISAEVVVDAADNDMIVGPATTDATANTASIGANDELLLTANVQGATSAMGVAGTDAIEARLVIGTTADGQPAVEVTGGPVDMFVLRQAGIVGGGGFAFNDDNQLIFTSENEDETIAVLITRDAGHTGGPTVSVSGAGTDMSPRLITITLASAQNATTSSFDAILNAVNTHTDSNGPDASDFVSVTHHPDSVAASRQNSVYGGSALTLPATNLERDPADTTPHVITITAPDDATWSAIESAINSDSEASGLVTASVPNTAHDTQVIEAGDQVGTGVTTPGGAANSLTLMQDGADVLTITAKMPGSSTSAVVPTIIIGEVDVVSTDLVTPIVTVGNISDDGSEITIGMSIGANSTWEQVATVINTTTNTILAPLISAEVSATAMAGGANADVSNNAADITGEGTLSGGTGTPDFVTVNDEFGTPQVRLISLAVGDSANNADLPIVTFQVVDDSTIARGTRIDEDTTPGTTVITSNPTHSQDWSFLVLSINSPEGRIGQAGLIRAELIDGGTPGANVPAFSGAVTLAGGTEPMEVDIPNAVLTGGTGAVTDRGDATNGAEVLAGGTDAPDQATVYDTDGVAQIRLISNTESGDRITFELVTGNSTSENIDTSTPGTVAITLTYLAGQLAISNWNAIAVQINSIADITNYLRAESVEAQASDAPPAELFSVELSNTPAAAPLTGGAGTPDVLTLTAGGGDAQLVFTSLIVGNNEEDGVPEIEVTLTAGGSAPVVSVSSGTEERTITITTPIGATWEDIRDAVNDHSVAGALVSVVGATGGNLAGEFAALDAGSRMLTGGTNAQDYVPSLAFEAESITDSSKTAFGLPVGTFSDAAGSTRFEVLYNIDDDTQDDAAEQVFVVINDNELVYIGENTGNAGNDYVLTVRGYDGPTADDFTEEYEYVVNIIPPLAVSSEGVREHLLIYGVEFRALEDGARPSGVQANYIFFNNTANNNVTLTSSQGYGIITTDFSQANIADLWNTDTTSNSRFVATIIEEMSNIPPGNTLAGWRTMEVGGVRVDGGGRTFIAGTDEADREVTEDSDLTASGWLKVTNGTGDITFGGTVTGQLGTAAHTDTRKYTYAGEYGNLVIDGDGDWVYTLGGTTTQNDDLAALTPMNGGTETFTVEVSRGGEMEELDIEIIVNGVDII